MRGAAVLLVALAAAGCGGRAALPRAAPHPPAPCAVAPRGGDRLLRVLPGTPAVIVHVPPGLRAGARVPLVLGLHGAGQDARGFEAESAFTQVADEHHFVVAYPQSWRPRGFWRYPEPDGPRSGLRLLRATIAASARIACIDPRRVLVTGISSGGRMTYAAGCELADRILAIAPVSGGTRMLPPCRPARPVSVLDVHGTADRIVAYRGRGADRDGRVADVLAAWARREGCRPRPRARRIDPYVTRLDWPRCREGARVVHLRIEGGGHAGPPHGGPPGIGIDGAEEIWRFFASVPSR
ncbi:MAG: alpha/beta hydrolase family esterase [Solirubrobacteraceae bacterium]